MFVIMFISSNILINAINSDTYNSYHSLITLDTNPPKGTKSVRYFIDDIRISELTDEYAKQTNTEPIWKTVVDPTWFESGERTLSIEAENYSGAISVEKKKIYIPAREQNKSTISLSGAWKFAEASDLTKGVMDGQSPEVTQMNFDDDDWATVLVPNSLGCVNQKWNNPNGILGVYRKQIELKAPCKNEQISLTLESCYWLGRVFVNGKEVGQTKGGYLPTRFDITPYIYSGKNQVSVIVDNRVSTMGLFKTLHVFYWNWGGLLQEVHIDRNPDVSLIDLKAEGTRSGLLKLRPYAVNKKDTEQKIDFNVKVYDPSGKEVKNLDFKSVVIPSNIDGKEISPVELEIKDPQLWDLGEGKLYTIVVSGKWGSLTERTGFRDVEVKNGDFLLNGKVVENLMGFNRHADYPGLGRTQPDELQYQELKELYDRGFRIFRPGHYPTTAALLNAADELGMLVIEEINVTGFHGPQFGTNEIKEFGALQLTKMIKRDRSHPSIIAWSVGNENLSDDERVADYIKETIGLGRKLDSSRLYTHVTWKADKDISYECQDLICQNFYGGWYSPKVDDVSKIVDDIHSVVNKPVLIAEYGAEAVLGQEGFGKGTEFYQGFIIDSYNRLLDGIKHFLGKLYWTSTEFWCRPDWDGGNPAPVTPFHCKAIQSYYRNVNKLGWKVIFSPVRLSLDYDSLGVQPDLFGGIIKVSPDKENEIQIKIRLSELKGKECKGVLSVIPALGFEAKKSEQSALQLLAPGVVPSKIKSKLPFILAPHETKTITMSISGKLPTDLKSSYCFIKAVIDEETEAQPLVLTIVQ